MLQSIEIHESGKDGELYEIVIKQDNHKRNALPGIPKDGKEISH